MMTEKLFYIDPYISGAVCNVIESEAKGANTVTVLDKTPFFPEGGGQQSDEGTIDGHKIISVTEKNGIVYHEVEGEHLFVPGQTVNAAADSKLRFKRMQAHTGEHIFSGIANTLYGAENTGFHMDGTVMTVDFDIPLTDEQLKNVETKANEAVWANLPVKTGMYTNDEAKKLSFRSKKDFDTDIRIVTIDGIDACACCAPHVKNTGEIGLIMLLSAVSHRGGVRMTLICGETAFSVARQRYSQVKAMAAMLTVPQNDAVEGLSGYMKKTEDIRLEKNTLSDRLCRNFIAGIEKQDGNTVVFCPLTPEEMTKAGALLQPGADKPVILLSGDDEKGYSYVITADNLSLSKKAKEINAALSGRGGGRDEMIRGVFHVGKDEIIKYFKDTTL